MTGITCDRGRSIELTRAASTCAPVNVLGKRRNEVHT